MPDDPLDIAAIRARAEAATPHLEGWLREAGRRCEAAEDPYQEGFEKLHEAADELAHARTDIPALADEVERLRADIADRQEAYETTLNSPCPDEQHCTCVPALRKRIAELEAELRRTQGRCSIAKRERDEARAALKTLLQRVDEMPNPHKDPMRHYYNQMRGVWVPEAEALLAEQGDSGSIHALSPEERRRLESEGLGHLAEQGES